MNIIKHLVLSLDLSIRVFLFKYCGLYANQ